MDHEDFSFGDEMEAFFFSSGQIWFALVVVSSFMNGTVSHNPGSDRSEGDRKRSSAPAFLATVKGLFQDGFRRLVMRRQCDLNEVD